MTNNNKKQVEPSEPNTQEVLEPVAHENNENSASKAGLLEESKKDIEELYTVSKESEVETVVNTIG